ncbi:hypothetical protein HPB52_010493 [Rhipicephalus sanguineus]|uniref:DDE-1 domain-containing protein n=1 Tax=Rhipicephalus sanguineus TaxID=34632 RepID=A0A9D4PNK7_RHISA|nr:hypothetical protein HPB52_010493 [Rhipicephalus sanguineus]
MAAQLRCPARPLPQPSGRSMGRARQSPARVPSLSGYLMPVQGAQRARSKAAMHFFASQHASRLLINIRLKVPTEVNIHQAAEILTGSWWNVKASTISNCWRKAGLLETSLTPQDCKLTQRDYDDEAELDPELWNELTEKLPVDAAATFEDYIDSDCAAATSAELTCEEIVSQEREQGFCSSDEDDAGDAESGTTEEDISSSDAVVFLEKTRSYLGRR